MISELTFVITAGVGGGLLTIMSYLIVPLYFDKKRGLANAIMLFAVSLGQSTCPLLIRFLQDEFGFRGATLIHGAIVLNSCIGICFYHPVKWHVKKLHRRAEEQPQEKVFVTKEIRELNMVNSTVDNQESQTSQSLSYCTEDPNPPHSESLANKPLQNTTKSLNVKDKTNLFGSTSFKPSICVTLLRIIRSSFSTISSLRSARVCIIVFTATIFITGYYNFIMMVPFSVQADGHTLDDAAWCLSIYSFCNLSRILMSVLSDCSWFNKRACYMAGYLIVSFSMFSKCDDILLKFNFL